MFNLTKYVSKNLVANLLAFVVTFVVSVAIVGWLTKGRNDASNALVNAEQSTFIKPEITTSDIKIKPETPKYIGCSAGSRGGRIKITPEKIYDLGSKENGKYKEILRKEDGEYEKFLLRTTREFKKSFLNYYILVVYKNGRMRAIFTYDSHEKYSESEDNFSGAGEFIEVRCEEIE